MEALFLDAAELPAAERSDFLDRRCAGNALLRQEVESLLAFDSGNTRPFAPIIEESAVSVVLSEAMIGRRVGAWRITASLGQGGMGTVFLATRADDQFRKLAAIKFIRAGVDQPQAIERFLRERQILANFDHPNIARLLDGGATEEGIPYFVMEYVEGRPIDTWTQDRGLSINERCELFLKVCEAVSYAHRNLVVHRDLKPNNILVNSSGSPILLDFGIARLLDEATSRELTQTGAWAMTPDYASPEQIRGLPATTATDVYSLGVVFYRLLTGTAPYRVSSTSALELERSVCEQQPPRPSEAASDHAIAGDLDTIVLMALRKEPERRYSSVEQFGEDIRRYLRGLPVIAREDTLAYRTSKFVRRHRVGVVAAGLVAASMVTGVVMTVRSERLAERQRAEAIAQREHAEAEHRIAERERDAASAASALATARAKEAEAQRLIAEKRLTGLLELGRSALFGIQGTLEHLPGALEARREIIATTLKYLDGLAKTSPGDAEVNTMLVTAYTQSGDVMGYPGRANLGNREGAIDAWRKASNILGRLRAGAPGNLRHRLQDLGLHQRIGVVLEASGDNSGALKEYLTALEIAKGLGRDFATDAHAVSQRGIIEHNLFVVLTARNDPSALDHNTEEILAHERALKLEPKNETFTMGMASAVATRGGALSAQGRFDEALVQLRRSQEIREKLVAAHPNNSLMMAGLARNWLAIAVVLGARWTPSKGDQAGASEAIEKSVTIYERLSAADPSDRKGRGDYAQVLTYAGIITMDSRSRERLQTAVSILKELRAAEPKQINYRMDAALAMEYLGHLLRDEGNPKGAADQYRQAIESYSRPGAVKALADLEAAASIR